jgi:hypothetical protein
MVSTLVNAPTEIQDRHVMVYLPKKARRAGKEARDRSSGNAKHAACLRTMEVLASLGMT